MPERDLSNVNDLMAVIGEALSGNTDQTEAISKNMNSAISHFDAAAAEVRKKNATAWQKAKNAAKDALNKAATAFSGSENYGGKK